MPHVVVVSGYKASELGIFQENHPSIHFIKCAIKKQLLVLLEEGLEWVVISGGLGTELWTAEVVFDLQEEGYEELKLAIITPFLKQEENWNEQRKEWYETLLLQADYVDSITKKPYENPWQFRLKNQFLIEKSDALLLFYDFEKEGSPQYLYETARKQAEKKDYLIYLIDFFQLQEIVEEEQMRMIDF